MLRRMSDAPLPGKRRRGRQKTRWKDSHKRDMENVGLKVEDVLDRTKGKRDIDNHSGDPRRRENPEKTKKFKQGFQERYS